MGHSRFVVLLVSTILLLSFGYGLGRVALMESVEPKHSIARIEEHYEKIRKMFEIMDYADPEPNINPKTGYLLSPPPPISATPPRG
ncbi:hypothetical protein RIF29_14451 [Crotalaria pallida]|uniref:Uncharacterized protein n=1 Tax=Crotalaria pallida TaxID=3830 RepID=A0AAN9FBB6_CROPI